MATSAWGIEHGESVSKAFSREEKIGGVANAAIFPVGSAYAGSKAKKGKGLKVAGKSAARGLAEGTAGGAVGGAVGRLASRGNPLGASAGSTIGGTAGVYHGTGASMRNSRKLGYMKQK